MLNPTSTRRTILLVDDSEPARELVYWSLGGPSSIFQLIPVSSASRALNILQDARVDLVITDLHMPEIDGIEFAGLLKSDPRMASIPIIMMSSDYSSSAKRRASAVGVESFLAKPFSPSDLLAAVDSALSGPHSVDHLATGQLTVQTMLDSIPYLAMILDENHRVIMGNKRFFELDDTGISDCPIQCSAAVHGESGVPYGCPLVESVATGTPCERHIDDEHLGMLLVSVYPLDITTEDGRRLYLHIARPVPVP